MQRHTNLSKSMRATRITEEKQSGNNSDEEEYKEAVESFLNKDITKS